MNKRTLYIIRGLPGSGKSTIAEALVGTANHRETDMFHIQDGKYVYDASKVTAAKAWCESEILKLIKEGKSCAVSNVFCHRRSYLVYERMAADHGFDIQVLECKGDFGSIHNVPEETLRAMRSNWQRHTTYRLSRKQQEIRRNNKY